MIALFLLLSAQAAEPAPDASPRSPQPKQVCRQAPASENVSCELTTPQQDGYRLPKYGPPAPQANRDKSVRIGAKATNRGAARRNRSMATVGIPF
jgi:hypothetical protein